MSPRSATLSDEEILIRATRAVRTHGPRVSLAQIAMVVGLSAARLVQRFGSRSQLLAAVEASVDARLRQHFVGGLQAHASPRTALVESLVALAERSAKRLYLLSNSYMFDPGHLQAPGGAENAKRRSAEFELELQRVIERMITAGEHPSGDAAELAHAVHACWVGSYTLWAYAPIGSVGDAVRSDLRFLLGAAGVSTRRRHPRVTTSNR